MTELQVYWKFFRYEPETSYFAAFLASFQTFPPKSFFHNFDNSFQSMAPGAAGDEKNKEEEKKVKTFQNLTTCLPPADPWLCTSLGQEVPGKQLWQ